MILFERETNDAQDNLYTGSEGGLWRDLFKRETDNAQDNRRNASNTYGLVPYPENAPLRRFAR